jgi:hypothetical protein
MIAILSVLLSEQLVSMPKMQKSKQTVESITDFCTQYFSNKNRKDQRWPGFQGIFNEYLQQFYALSIKKSSFELKLLIVTPF